MLHDGTATTAAAPSDSTHVPKPKPLQFSLRTLLVALAVFPLLLAVVVRFPALLIWAALCIVLGLMAVGCMKLAERLVEGGTSWHTFAAAAMAVAGMSALMLLFMTLLSLVAAFTALLFFDPPSR